MNIAQLTITTGHEDIMRKNKQVYACLNQKTALQYAAIYLHPLHVGIYNDTRFGNMSVKEFVNEVCSKFDTAFDLNDTEYSFDDVWFDVFNQQLMEPKNLVHYLK